MINNNLFINEMLLDSKSIRIIIRTRHVINDRKKHRFYLYSI